jgi:hypothetical protein
MTAKSRCLTVILLRGQEGTGDQEWDDRENRIRNARESTEANGGNGFTQRNGGTETNGGRFDGPPKGGVAWDAATDE